MNLLPFRVYQILSEYTDGDHALAMGELLRLLRTEYGLRCDRRAAYAALDKLRAVSCHIPEYQDDGEGYRLLSRALEPSEVCQTPCPPFQVSHSASVNSCWTSFSGA